MTAERLSVAHRALKDLADRALAEKKSRRLTFVDFVREDAAEDERPYDNARYLVAKLCRVRIRGPQTRKDSAAYPRKMSWNWST